MKTEHQDVKERYEQPVVLDISPVCTVIVEGESMYDTFGEEEEQEGN